jgi:diguanylate cyclase (GGDEF)-like protein/PAS domain S-box-containing protein
MPTSTTRLLLIEDDADDVRLLRKMLGARGLPATDLTIAASIEEAEAHLAKAGTDVVLLDLELSGARDIAALRRARAAAPRVALVVLTALEDESLALQAVKEGAQDYLIKGQIDARGLLRAVRHAIERKAMEDALFEEKERAQVTLQCIGDAVACTDISGRITFLNVIAERLSGWSCTDAAGKPFAEILNIVDTSTRVAIPDVMLIAAGHDGIAHLPSTCSLIARDGKEVAMEVSIAPIRGREGQKIGAVVVVHDVSAARAMAAQLTHAAQHDVLTGLPNRMLLHDRVTHALSLVPRHMRKVAVMFLDLDGFKHINDTLGHRTGDKLLLSVAQRLAGCVRASDTVSRQGGDEFVVLLSGMEQSEDAAITAERMLEAVAKPHFIEGHELYVTTSIGVSVYPDDGIDAETLIKNADTAMYQAKENGHKSCQFFKPAMNVRAEERRFMEQSLRRALVRCEFALHYQPKIDLRTGAITGAEALIRWTDPARGPVSPGEFIAVAEECGLILPIGKWVLREACQQAQSWVEAGLPLVTMSVNISAAQFRDSNFVASVLAVLGETGLDARNLELELTESVLMKRVESTAAVVQALRAHGVRVALDDFGTGYSSLSYLQKFPIDSLKIDESFVRQITSTGFDSTIVTAAISMARNLKMRVVAEGVETLEECDFLRAHDCDESQGHYFSKPVLPDAFARLLKEGIGASPAASGGTAIGAALLPGFTRGHAARSKVPLSVDRAGTPV